MMPDPRTENAISRIGVLAGAALFVFLADHVAGSAASSLTPRATIRSVPSGSGCCSFKASSGGAV